jgi:hypothetical protein
VKSVPVMNSTSPKLCFTFCVNFCPFDVAVETVFRGVGSENQTSRVFQLDFLSSRSFTPDDRGAFFCAIEVVDFPHFITHPGKQARSQGRGCFPLFLGPMPKPVRVATGAKGSRKSFA